MQEGVRATLHATAGLPRRHPFAISGAALGLALILLFAGLFDVSNRVDVIHKDTTKLVHAANVCGNRSLSHPRRSRECANRLRNALLNCRRYSSCRSALLRTGEIASRHRKTVPGRSEVRASPTPSLEGGGSQQPVRTHAGQKPSPAPVGGHAHPKESSPAPSEPKGTVESLPSAPSPTPLPGNSGGGASSEHGVKQCVDVAVSACVKLEVP